MIKEKIKTPINNAQNCQFPDTCKESEFTSVNFQTPVKSALKYAFKDYAFPEVLRIP